MVSKEWFYHFLKSFKGGFLMAAHDRHFLDNACSHIFELERGNGRLFTGNFGAYVTQKEALREHLLATRERQEREIARKQASIDRMKALASRATQAQSMIKQLERIELVDVEPALPTIRLKLPHTARPGKVVLTLSHLAHSFGDKSIFKNVNAQIVRGQKVALVAPNGVGKTTLFNVIAGKVACQQGTVEFGYNVQHAVFEQDQTKVLAPDNTIVDEVKSSTNASEAHVRAMLGALLFSGDDILKKTKVLSGGERNRVAMAKVFLRNANFLLLDEPTNHLDLYAKEVLLNALLDYDGTLLFVSHDHDFINRLATRIIELTPHGTAGYDGTYEGYLWFKKQQEQAHVPKTEPKKHAETNTASEKQQQNEEKNSALRKEIHEIEREISKIEKRIQEATHKLSLVTYGSADFQKYSEKITRDTAHLESLTARWQELYTTLE
jgi:ATP-binding cassette subfamily F protein 3